MSKIYIPGPAYVWIGTGVPYLTAGVYTQGSSASQYEFFGFTERGLRISVTPQTEDVAVDYAGNMPADVAMLGVEAGMAGAFTRYNEFLLRNLMASLNNVQALFGPQQSVGTLFQSEPPYHDSQGNIPSGIGAAGPPLLVYSPYSFKAEFNLIPNTSTYDMIHTIRFYSAYVNAELPQMWSVRRKAPEVTWRAIPIFGTYSGSYPSGSFVPYGAPYDTYALGALDENAVLTDIISGALVVN
jgi:hypothetical protein